MQATSRAPSGDASAAAAFSQDECEAFRRSYAENGYLVLRDIVPKEKLSHLRGQVIEEYERAKASGALFSGGGGVSGHLNCFPGQESRFVYESMEKRGVIALIKAIFTRPLGGLHIGCNLNLPGSTTQHYHVDSAFLDEFLIVNTAVVDTDLVNGAIDVVPGTQKKFYKYWRFAVEAPWRHNARIPMNQGDVLIRSSNLWHRGMPNRSPVPRPMVAFTFGDPGVRPLPDAFTADNGKITFHPNWFRPNFLGRLRERTFVAAPITYASYRFVRSLVGDKGYGTPKAAAAEGGTSVGLD